MNRKIIILILITMYLFATVTTAQPCGGTGISCLSTATRHANSSGSWVSSHGSMTYSSADAPTSTGGSSMELWSILNAGNGAYTCYKFVLGTTYKVCFWVRNSSGFPGNPFGRLYVYAANPTAAQFSGSSSTTIPSGVSKQLIDDNYMGPGSAEMDPSTGNSAWKFISVTFTANNTYGCLWLYAANPAGPGPAGPLQYNPIYTLEVDDIRVEPSPASPAMTITQSSPNPVAGCAGPITLTITGMPANTIATWKTPGVTPNNANRSNVTVQPCSTTTYEVEITHPGAVECATCMKQLLTHTVVVNQWSEAARVIYPTSVIPCLTPYTLSYNDPGTCAAMSANANYTWIKPDGTVAGTGKILPCTSSVYHNGQWTLKIRNSLKNCEEEQKFNLSVGSCCRSNPDFSFIPGTNPVTFTSTGGGIINPVSSLWSFGDGTKSDVPNPVHTYNVTVPTTFTVCLTTLFEDDLGESCCNRICKTIRVNPPASGACTAVANFNFNYIPGAGQNINYTNTSSGSGTICRTTWNFGDGSPPMITTLPTITHNMTSAGPWTVCMTVKNCVFDATGKEIDSCFSTKCQLVPRPPAGLGKPGDTPPQDQMQNAIQGAMSISTIDNDNTLVAYPNPNQGNFTLYLYNHVGSYNVIVRDKLSRVIYNSEHVFNHAPVNIALNDEANGVYSVEVRNDKEHFVQQISIIK